VNPKNSWQRACAREGNAALKQANGSQTKPDWI
jgi:hypothetical protein